MDFLSPQRALLLSYAIMPDHFHMLVQPQPGWSLSQIVQTVKGYSSRVINDRAGQRGRLWQRSFYDRVIRDNAQLLQCIDYIHLNPVKARHVSEPEWYRWSSAFPDAVTDRY